MKSKQVKMNLFKGRKGGRRPGSGRKRIQSKGVAHRTREKVSLRTPLHINFKYRTQIKNKHCLKLLKKAIMNARSHGLKVVHFSLQSNHVHLIVESENNQILSTGMRSLTITFAKGLKLGKVQLERYHLHVLKSIREAKNAAFYVMFNQQNHERGTYSCIDEFSSLLYLDRALDLIRIYSKLNQITLRIKRTEYWEIDMPGSYLLKQGINQLFN